MTEQQESFLHLIKPGEAIPNDWFKGLIPSNIKVGENSVIDSSQSFKTFFSKLPIALIIGSYVTIWRASFATEENGLIEIGDYCYLAGASLVASQKITIGNRVLIAGGATIIDSDFHPIAPAARLADTIAISPLGNHNKRPTVKSKPVVIGDDVWIGYNATILKGVTIGAGAIITPGSVVTENVAAGITVAGNPAKPVEI
ncbi:acyltransferase [uncultured Mucilaginibacter sp.]|uniref:acyltransferase n=1 Tax=uncultured Mucilaginibacter sp. TaxID=797541 RepID=UPI00260CB95A|nr:acyltransferase [uncultured Mucilaginibacter sp.]